MVDFRLKSNEIETRQFEDSCAHTFHEIQNLRSRYGVVSYVILRVYIYIWYSVYIHQFMLVRSLNSLSNISPIVELYGVKFALLWLCVSVCHHSSCVSRMLSLFLLVVVVVFFSFVVHSIALANIQLHRGDDDNEQHYTRQNKNLTIWKNHTTTVDLVVEKSLTYFRFFMECTRNVFLGDIECNNKELF